MRKEQTYWKWALSTSCDPKAMAIWMRTLLLNA